MAGDETLRHRSFATTAAALLTLVALCRIVATYRVTSVAWDEPEHISAGLGWVDKVTYALEPIQPPLSRTAIGLPLYLAGERVPSFSDGTLRGHNYYEVGTKILYDSGHYFRNLSLARSGVLPFFVLLAALVYYWARSLFGDLAALVAVALFTTTPSILAFSGLAYTDMTTACTQFAALLAFASWMQKPDRWRTALLGITLGLALLSKMTTLLYLPACAAGMVLCRWAVRRFRAPAPQNSSQPGSAWGWTAKLGLVALISMVVLWGGYRFSIGHVQEAMGLSSQAMPSFQHFPGPVRGLAERAVASNWVVPAPALIQGLSIAWVVNKMSLPSYMFGTETSGGVWYFFFVALAVKAPLSLLALWLVGLGSLLTDRRKDWEPFALAIAPIMVLVASIPVHYKEGVRHVLVVFPLLAVLAGHGWTVLWSLTGNKRLLGKAAALSLVLWQCVSSIGAGRDYISYYNALAGRDPGRIYLTGCDLDCGQDIFRLAQEARRRRISTLNIAVWSASDIYRMDLPKLEILQPYTPVTGWVAISVRSLRLGQLFHTAYPPDAFAWLNRYQPVQQVGKTIFLYWIPEEPRTTGRRPEVRDSYALATSAGD
jgi:4-amino-4-deoxy-L-arabinose transferase-like glycosyltransferase